ncbi:MAG: transporter substrate-binding domain-containing protein [Marinobacter sp.]|uniref:substrate-binding periplasmic protein n=1 Tax=Marinobacter sp. TaxID=50741 RepID=UPI00396ECBF7
MSNHARMYSRDRVDRPPVRFYVWVTLVLLALGAPLSRAEAFEQGGVLRIAYNEFPPFAHHTESGEASGLIIEMTRKVAKEAGYQPEFLFLPISRVYLYLKNGMVDAWPGLTNIPQLEGEVLESWVQPMTVQLSAWYLAGKSPLNHFDDFKGKTVIVIGGYTYAGLIQWLQESDQVLITEAPNHRAAIDMLKRHRGDYVLDYHAPVREILTEPSDSVVRESEIRSRTVAWLFSLVGPRAAILREAFDDAYLRLVQRGELPVMPRNGQGYVIPGFPEAYR